LKVVFRLLLRKKLFTIGTYLGFYLLVFLFLDDTKVLNFFVFVVFYVRNEGFEAGLKYWLEMDFSNLVYLLLKCFIFKVEEFVILSEKTGLPAHIITIKYQVSIYFSFENNLLFIIALFGKISG
jgi:hypothetical protein